METTGGNVREDRYEDDEEYDDDGYGDDDAGDGSDDGSDDEVISAPAAGPADTRDRATIRRDAISAGVRQGLQAVAVGIGMALVMGCFISMALPSGAALTLVLIVAIAAFPAGLITGWGVYKQAVKDESREAGLCPMCGFDLRGSTGRCPECGHRITRVMVRRKPR